MTEEKEGEEKRPFTVATVPEVLRLGRPVGCSRGFP